MPKAPAAGPLIGIVGPCGAGKSTLLAALTQRGFRCTHIAQEHSYVPSMWLKIAGPDRLIYLHASFDTCTRRRQLSWLQADYLEQLNRLAHARAHADLIIDTDDILAEEVVVRALEFLEAQT
jgi:ATPase subunit of ABC transporter with duplicated ATPase domains